MLHILFSDCMNKWLINKRLLDLTIQRFCVSHWHAVSIDESMLRSIYHC